MSFVSFYVLLKLHISDLEESLGMQGEKYKNTYNFYDFSRTHGGFWRFADMFRNLVLQNSIISNSLNSDNYLHEKEGVYKCRSTSRRDVLK